MQEVSTKVWLDVLSLQLQMALDEVRVELDDEFDITKSSEPVLSAFTPETLIQFAHRADRDICQQDAVWRATLRCYQRRSSRLWAPVVLEMLAPTIISEAYRFLRRFPTVEAADIRQQFLAAALDASASATVEESARFVKRSLTFAMRRRVRRWMGRVLRDQHTDLGDLTESVRIANADDREPAVWELSELMMSRARASDVALLVRIGVLGLSLEEVAAREGISLEAAKSRLRRARQRLRELLLPELGGRPRGRSSRRRNAER